MSISTYAELQTAVDNWMHRDDLTARVPEFIQMGEAVLNRKLRTVDMETRATITTGTTSRFLGLPTGFIEMRSMFIQNPAKELFYLDPQSLRDRIVSETDTAEPEFFTIKDEIELDCIPSTALTLEQHYLKKYDIATDLTNWLLTNYPELYLHAALASAVFYIMDDPRLPTIKSLLSEGIAELNRLEARKRGGHMSKLRVDSALVGAGRYNITTG